MAPSAPLPDLPSIALFLASPHTHAPRLTQHTHHTNTHTTGDFRTGVVLTPGLDVLEVTVTPHFWERVESGAGASEGKSGE